MTTDESRQAVLDFLQGYTDAGGCEGHEWITAVELAAFLRELGHSYSQGTCTLLSLRKRGLVEYRRSTTRLNKYGHPLGLYRLPPPSPESR